MKKHNKIRVLMCGSDINAVKGGMVSISRNYLKTDLWKKTEVSYLATHREGSGFIKLGVFILAYIHILERLITKQVDVMLLNVSERGSVYRKMWIMKLAHLFHVPVIFHHHGAEFDDFYKRLTEKKRRVVQRALTEADLNLALSVRQMQEMLKKAPKAQVDYLYNAVEVKQQNEYRTDAVCIISMGRLGQRKGTYDLLRAIAELNHVLPESVKVLLCGDGEIEKVKQAVKAGGLEKRVVHVGWVDGGKKEEYLQKAMLHILPSYREVLPMSILETMARGIPNIGTDIAAVPEVIEDGVNGFLITPGDTEALKARILELTENEPLRKSFSEHSYQKIRETFSLEKNIEKLEGIFEDLAGGKREARGIS